MADNSLSCQRALLNRAVQFIITLRSKVLERCSKICRIHSTERCESGSTPRVKNAVSDDDDDDATTQYCLV